MYDRMYVSSSFRLVIRSSWTPVVFLCCTSLLPDENLGNEMKEAAYIQPHKKKKKEEVFFFFLESSSKTEAEHLVHIRGSPKFSNCGHGRSLLKRSGAKCFLIHAEKYLSLSFFLPLPPCFTSLLLSLWMDVVYSLPSLVDSIPLFLFYYSNLRYFVASPLLVLMLLRNSL